MKKIVSLLLLVTMVLTLLALTSCGSEFRLGLGVEYSATAPTDAEAATDDTAAKAGATTATYTVCALTIDKNGKITACTFDAFDAKLEYTATGENVVLKSLKTKREQGTDYGMVAYGGAKLEWFEQADALAKTLIGKGKADIASLVTADGKGSTEVTTAGCTITVSDFIKAAEKAYAAAEKATATSAEGVTLSVKSEQSGKAATDSENGNVTVSTAFEAVCGEEKAKASFEATVTFDKNGAAAKSASDVITVVTTID